MTHTQHLFFIFFCENQKSVLFEEVIEEVKIASDRRTPVGQGEEDSKARNNHTFWGKYDFIL